MKTILVTAIGSFSADAVIKTYKREGCRVLGCDIYPAQWVVNSREVEVFYKAPYATEKETYREFIKDICVEQQVDYVVPLTDVEVDALTGWTPGAASEPGTAPVPGSGSASARPAVVCISQPGAIALCRDKYRMEQYLNPLGICRTIPGQLLSAVRPEELDYPVVVKPCNGRSSQGLRMVECEAQLRQVMKECEADADNYLVQHKMSGSVVTVDVVRDPADGQTVCLPRRELLRTLNGAGTSVYVFRDEELERQSREIAEAIGVCGCVNLEFVETKEPEAGAQGAESRDAGSRGSSGTWYFLECNPRFAGGVAFSCTAGYDMVMNHLRCFEGQKIQGMEEIRPQYIARRYQEYVME